MGAMRQQAKQSAALIVSEVKTQMCGELTVAIKHDCHRLLCSLSRPSSHHLHLQRKISP